MIRQSPPDTSAIRGSLRFHRGLGTKSATRNLSCECRVAMPQNLTRRTSSIQTVESPRLFNAQSQAGARTTTTFNFWGGTMPPDPRWGVSGPDDAPEGEQDADPPARALRAREAESDE